MKPKRVLVIGGYGNFGSYIARRLAMHSEVQLIIAGRSKEKAVSFSERLQAQHAVESVALDITKEIDKALKAIAPDIVIHTSGPYQGQDYDVASAAIAVGAHYIDIADARAFVSNISCLDDAAKEQNVLVVSGASSVPGLSSALIDHYGAQFSELRDVDYGITTAQITNRGAATTSAVLSYAGKPFRTLMDGHMKPVYGWQNIHCHMFAALGKRYLGNCDIPDLELFPQRYPSLRNHRFYAGQELAVLHIGLWGLSWLARLGVLPRLDRFAATLLRTSFCFDKFGTDTSGFYMCLSGIGRLGQQKQITFDLTARSGHGPFIPCMPAVLLTEKLVEDRVDDRGAMPCLGLVTLEEYLGALKPLDISWEVGGC